MPYSMLPTAGCLRTIAGRLIDVIAPRLCPSCDAVLRDDESCYCAACRASLEPAPFPRELFEELAIAIGHDELALSAVGGLYTFRQDGPVQRLIHALKYLGCYDLGVALGAELGRSTSMFVEFDDVDCVVPIPLHPARRRERGYNQAEAIARGVSLARDVDLVDDALLRARHTRSQTRLGADERLRNVGSAFAAGPVEVRGRSVMICDDVCTTGATLNACAEILLVRGAARVVAATVAKDVLVGRRAQEEIPSALYGLR